MISENIKFAMHFKNIGIQQLADQADIPFETLKNIYYGRVSDVKLSTVIKIANTLNVSIDWLAGRSAYTEKEITILDNYRSCGNHGKSIIELIAKFESCAAIHERNSEGKHLIPRLIPLGHITDGIMYNTCNTVEIETADDRAYLAIDITTNNFAPAYCMNDIILLENRFPAEGERAVFCDGLKAYFRLFERDGKIYRLKCLNGRGKDMMLSRMDEVDCIGTCIGVIRA